MYADEDGFVIQPNRSYAGVPEGVTRVNWNLSWWRSMQPQLEEDDHDR